MENEFEYPAGSGKGDHDFAVAEEFVKNIVPSRSYRDFSIAIRLSLLGDS